MLEHYKHKSRRIPSHIAKAVQEEFEKQNTAKYAVIHAARAMREKEEEKQRQARMVEEQIEHRERMEREMDRLSHEMKQMEAEHKQDIQAVIAEMSAKHMEELNRLKRDFEETEERLTSTIDELGTSDNAKDRIIRDLRVSLREKHEENLHILQLLGDERIENCKLRNRLDLDDF